MIYYPIDLIQLRQEMLAGQLQLQMGVEHRYAEHRCPMIISFSESLEYMISMCLCFHLIALRYSHMLIDQFVGTNGLRGEQWKDRVVTIEARLAGALG
jgi:hypothetical protein